jgi:hypothetical protein
MNIRVVGSVLAGIPVAVHGHQQEKPFGLCLGDDIILCHSELCSYS